MVPPCFYTFVVTTYDFVVAVGVVSISNLYYSGVINNVVSLFPADG